MTSLFRWARLCSSFSIGRWLSSEFVSLHQVVEQVSSDCL